jgi:rhodanese-related sulfurtransferase
VDTRRLAADTPAVPDEVERRTLEELLAEAERRITRHTPEEAFAAVARGAILVDIRAADSRDRDGVVPGSLHIPRTVLEWRLDPGDSTWRNPHAPGLGDDVILICDHGCSTVLAAATLVDLGFTRAGDVAGGFAAWRAAGLPVRPWASRPLGEGELAGIGPPTT